MMENYADQRPVQGFLQLQDLLEEVFHRNDENENLTAIEANRKKMEILLDMRQHLSMKRLVVEKFLNGTEAAKRSNNSDGRRWNTIVHNVWDKKDSLVIWNEAIKTIEGKFGSGVGSYFRFLRVLLAINVFSFLICFGLVVAPQLLHRTEEKLPYPEEIKLEDFITGEGWLAGTELFYGTYTSGNISLSSSNDGYSMPKAYFFANFSLYLAILLYISIKTAKLYSRNFIQSHATVPYEFFNKVFAGWDFAIVGKYAKVKSTALKTELKLLLEKTRSDAEKGAHLNWMEILLNAFLWIFSIGVIVGVAFGLNEMFDMRSEAASDNFTSIMKIPFTITALMLGVPWLLALLDSLKTSSSSNSAATRSKIYQTLTKTILLEMTIISVLMIKNYTTDNDASCWENDVGQEMYRLLLLFFIGVIMISFLLETVYKLLQTRSTKLFHLSPPEFDTARNTMHLIYGQTLTWIAIYYSPLSPLIFTIILLATFYIKLLSLRWNCSISTKPWIAAQSETVFFMYTFVSLIGVSAYFIYSISRISSSHDCGPFQDFLHPYELMGGTRTLNFIFKPGVAACLLAALMTIFHYVRAQRIARRKQVAELKTKLGELRMENELLARSSLKVQKLAFELSRRSSLK